MPIFAMGMLTQSRMFATLRAKEFLLLPLLSSTLGTDMRSGLFLWDPGCFVFPGSLGKGQFSSSDDLL